MSRTGPDSGRYWPISSRNRCRRIQNRTQQYERTMGSSYARMIRRMMSARIDDVAVPAAVDAVAEEPSAKPGEVVDPLVAAARPAPLDQHDELRRMRVETGKELLAQP